MSEFKNGLVKALVKREFDLLDCGASMILYRYTEDSLKIAMVMPDTDRKFITQPWDTVDTTTLINLKSL